jgi:hypothetical protein
MEIILLSIYIVAWLLFNGIIYKTGMYESNPSAPQPAPISHIRPIGPRGVRHYPEGPPQVAGLWELILANKYLILFETLFFIAFLLLVFLGPQIQSLNEAEEKARKRYEELNDDIFKQPWLDAVSNRNRYYLLTFLMFAFLPFFYLLWYVSSSPSPMAFIPFQWFDVFVLQLTAGFEGFVLFLYTLFSQKSWYFYSIPLVYAFVFKMVNSNRSTITVLKNYFMSSLCILWAFLYFSKTSILWSVPFFIILPLLIMT